VPESEQPLPPGIATVTIDATTGALMPAGSPGSLSELIRVDDIARLQRRSFQDERTLNAEESFDIF
jgi:penicillin-binding protein 1A